MMTVNKGELIVYELSYREVLLSLLK
jgi:hypothetical protein